MHRAHRRDAVNTQKFYFRKDVFSPAPGHGCNPLPLEPNANVNGSALNGLPVHENGYSTHERTATNGSFSGVRAPSPAGTCSSHPTSPRSRSPAPGDVNGNFSSRSTSDPGFQFGPVEDEYAEFTINEIINGTKDGLFPGLLGVVNKYLDSLNVAPSVRAKLDESLELIKRRADGEHCVTISASQPKLGH